MNFRRRPQSGSAVALLTTFTLYCASGSFNVALPSIMKQCLDNDTSMAAGVALAFGLMSASTVAIWGRLVDRLGARQVLAIGSIVYLVGGIGTVCQSSYAGLLAFQVVTGLGDAMLLSGSLAALIESVDPLHAAQSQGLYHSASAIGGFSGAIVGGLVTEYVSWRAGMVLPGICVLLILWKLALWHPTANPKSDASRSMRPDYLGATLLFLWLGLLMFGVVNGGDEVRWISPTMLIVAASTIVLFLGWWYVEHHSRFPLVDVALLWRNPRLRMATLLVSVSPMFCAGLKFLVPVYLAKSYNYTAVEISWVLVIYSISRMVCSPLAGALADRSDSFRVMKAGLMLQIAGFLCFIVGLNHSMGVVPFVILAAAGASFLSPVASSWLLAHSPAQKKGMMIGTYQMINAVSAILGLGIFECVYSNAELPTIGCFAVCLGAIAFCMFVFYMAFTRQTTIWLPTPEIATETAD